MAIIEIENLTKSYRVYQKQEGVWASVQGLFKRSYREVDAVRSIDLEVEEGEFVAFLGPNGAGKTTTLKLLSGVIHPDSGRCRVMGYVPWERTNEYRRRFALVMGQKTSCGGICRRWNLFACISIFTESIRPNSNEREMNFRKCWT